MTLKSGLVVLKIIETRALSKH